MNFNYSSKFSGILYFSGSFSLIFIGLGLELMELLLEFAWGIALFYESFLLYVALPDVKEFF